MSFDDLPEMAKQTIRLSILSWCPKACEPELLHNVIQEHCSASQAKRCFSNAANYVLSSKKKNIKYVFGFVLLEMSGGMVIPLEHAFVHEGHRYLDITLMNPELKYVKVLEIKKQDLMEYMDQKNSAPDLREYGEYISKKK